MAPAAVKISRLPLESHTVSLCSTENRSVVLDVWTFIIAHKFCQCPGREVAFRYPTFIDCHVDQGKMTDWNFSELIGNHMWSLMQTNCVLFKDLSSSNIKQFAKCVALGATTRKSISINEFADTRLFLIYQRMVWLKMINSTHPFNSFKVVQTVSSTFQDLNFDGLW